MKNPLGDIRGPAVWVLVGCGVCQMGLGTTYLFGVTLKHIVSEFEWSRALYAGATTPLLFGMALFSPVVGHATERIGPQRVLSSSVVLLGAAFFLFSRMQSAWEFYAISLMLGLALAGLGDVPVGAVASQWVAKGRGLALGLIYTGSNVGGVLITQLVAAVAAWATWRDALRVVAAVTVVTILPVAWRVVRLPPRDWSSGTEIPEAPVAGAEALPHDDDLTLAEALRTRTFWVFAGVLFLFYFYYLANNHLVAFLSDQGYSDARAAASFGGAIFLGIGGKLGMGLIADRVDARRALIANFAVLTLGSFALLGIPRSGAFLAVFLLSHGIATAAENVLLPLIVAECFGVRHMARIYGVLMVMLLPGGALGPIFAGAVFDRFGDYTLAWWTIGLANVLALAALFAVRRERKERIT